MGDLRIGTIYPPSLGWVSKIFCGTELVWPHLGEPNGESITLHLVRKDMEPWLYTYVKQVPIFEGWIPSKIWETLMTFYGYEQIDDALVDFTILVEGKLEDDGTYSIKNTIRYEDGTVVVQEHPSEISKDTIDKKKSFDVYVDMYRWFNRGTHYNENPITLEIGSQIFWRVFNETPTSGFLNEYTTRNAEITITRGVPTSGKLDTFDFVDDAHDVLWEYDGSTLKMWVSPGAEYRWEGLSGDNRGGDETCDWNLSFIHSKTFLNAEFHAWKGTEKKNVTISMGSDPASPLRSRTISADEFMTMMDPNAIKEVKFWAQDGFSDYVIAQLSPDTSYIIPGFGGYVTLMNSDYRMINEYHIIKDEINGGYKYYAAVDTFLKISDKKDSFKVVVHDDADREGVLASYTVKIDDIPTYAAMEKYPICYVNGVPRAYLDVHSQSNAVIVIENETVWPHYTSHAWSYRDGEFVITDTIHLYVSEHEYVRQQRNTLYIANEADEFRNWFTLQFDGFPGSSYTVDDWYTLTTDTDNRRFIVDFTPHLGSCTSQGLQDGFVVKAYTLVPEYDDFITISEDGMKVYIDAQVLRQDLNLPPQYDTLPFVVKFMIGRTTYSPRLFLKDRIEGFVIEDHTNKFEFDKFYNDAINGISGSKDIYYSWTDYWGDHSDKVVTISWRPIYSAWAEQPGCRIILDLLGQSGDWYTSTIDYIKKDGPSPYFIYDRDVSFATYHLNKA